MAFYATLASPIGELLLIADSEHRITHVDRPARLASLAPNAVLNPSALSPALAQLDEYFAGTRKKFDPNLAFPKCSNLQLRLYSALLALPFGSTTTYASLARSLSTSPRAIGRANAMNPIAIIVPCHRVVGSDGKLTGYAWGVEHKAWLLEHEGLEIEDGKIKVSRRPEEKGRKQRKGTGKIQRGSG